MRELESQYEQGKCEILSAIGGTYSGGFLRFVAAGAQLLSKELKRSKLPSAFFLATFLEAVFPNYWSHYWQISNMDRLLDILNLRPSEIVLDVGANVGLFTLAAADKVGPDGKVVASEPEPNNLLALRIRARGTSNIIPIAAAAWNHATTLKLHRSTNSLWHSVKTIKRKVGKTERDTIEVPCTTIDLIARSFVGDHVDVLKISVEGSELEALEGAINTIPRCRAIAIQCALDEESREKTNTIMRLLQDYGFKQTILRLSSTWVCIVFLNAQIKPRRTTGSCPRSGLL